MGFLDKIGGAILVSLFIFALLMFGYSAQIENDINNTILDDPHFSGVNDSFSSVLGDVRDDADTQRVNFESQDPQSGEDDGFGLLTVPKNIAKFTSMMFRSFNLIGNLLENIFGVPSLVFNILGGLLVIILVVLGWRVIKGAGT